MNKKKKWGQYISTMFFVLLGAVCGFLMIAYGKKMADIGKSDGEVLLSFALLFAAMYLAIYLHMIIHEAGHLVFGLISGYKFSSFRVMSFMWVKESGKIKLKRLTVAGTGGQCLMAPPELVNGKMPVVLYNMGGAAMNIIAAALFFGLHFAAAEIPLLSTVFLMMAVIGVMMAIMNGVPMRMGTVDNDGYNTLSLTRSKDACRSLWIQLKVNEQISKGVRSKDMPEEWFVLPSDEEMKNGMTAVIGVFACCRLMDEHRFEEAESTMAHLLEIDSGITGLHRGLMVCDRIYCELIGENRSEVLCGMMDKEQKRFMKSMKSFPSVLRTEYVYAALCEKDGEKAAKIMEQFEKRAKSYPYPNEIQAERELIAIAENCETAKKDA